MALSYTQQHVNPPLITSCVQPKFQEYGLTITIESLKCKSLHHLCFDIDFTTPDQLQFSYAPRQKMRNHLYTSMVPDNYYSNIATSELHRIHECSSTREIFMHTAKESMHRLLAMAWPWHLIRFSIMRFTRKKVDRSWYDELVTSLQPASVKDA